ncbi:MAG: hypothetical protein ACKVHU_14240 [Acidimicrobiales bacterium]|jgi:hypothetical protein
MSWVAVVLGSAAVEDRIVEATAFHTESGLFADEVRARGGTVGTDLPLLGSTPSLAVGLFDCRSVDRQVEVAVEAAVMAQWEVQKTPGSADMRLGVHFAVSVDRAIAGAAALAAVANRRQILVSGSVERQCHDLDARGMGMAQLEQADAATEEAAQEVLWLLTDSRMNVGRLPLHLPD